MNIDRLYLTITIDDATMTCRCPPFFPAFKKAYTHFGGSGLLLYDGLARFGG